MGHHSRGGITFLGRLIADRAGNTLAIAAAALLPMMALIGGGVDVSRAYMAKTQLQSACDAGVLAGRKAMSKTGVYEDAEKAKASKMFNFNFSSGALDAENVVFSTQDNADGQVLGTATATVPTLVMKIFKMDTVDLSVSCMAELQIGNADIMFVLDTTGSMNCTPEDNKANCTQLPTSYTNTRIVGLRDAVIEFHKTINQSVLDTRTRIRYGFVPYSQTINIGGLIASGDMPSSYLVDSNTYQTRRAVFGPATTVTAPYTGTPGSPVKTTEYYYNSSGTKTKISATNCTNFGKNTYPSGSAGTPVNSGGPAPTNSVVTSYSYGGRDGTGTNEYCWRNKSVVTTTYAGTTWYLFNRWVYEPRTFNTQTFKAKTAYKYATGITYNNTALASSSRTTTQGTWDMLELANKVTDGTAVNVPTSTTTWSGCIEERTTETPYSSYDFDPIPDSALDLDLDTAPTDAASSWRPQWGVLEFDRSYTNYYLKYSDGKYYQTSAYSGNSISLPGAEGNTCPAEMMLLRDVELSDKADDVPSWLTTYVNNLVATGSTYHDLGMIWGGRLTSSDGIFAENVTRDADKISVSKHIIFMTDGKMEPSLNAYSAYGLEDLDHRVAPSGTDTNGLTARHNARFAAMCEAIKAQGTTIWVVAFSSGTTMSTTLQNCASDGRAYYSSNTLALRNTFKFIAAQVADLRLGA